MKDIKSFNEYAGGGGHGHPSVDDSGPSKAELFEMIKELQKKVKELEEIVNIENKIPDRWQDIEK